MRAVGFFYVNCGHPDTEELARKMIESVKRTIKGATIFQMTNEYTKRIKGVDEMIVRPAGAQALMHARADHYAHFPHEALFLDPDIIVQKDPWAVFDQDFDVALTKRVGQLFVDGKDTADTMPYNTGVTFARNPQFWKTVYLRMKDMPLEERRWFGEQVAVAEVAKGGAFNILELSCEDYNYSPNKRGEEAPEKFVLHYKGPTRKLWMLAQAC